jgi:alpha-L-fucosidase
MQGEVRELLSRCGRIDLMWFDWDGREPVYDQAATYALTRTLQPRIVINNRLDLGVGNNDNQILSAYADYYTPEQRIGRYDDERPWETCMTLGTQWSWKPDDTVKMPKEVIGILARTVGGDGNLLLNVGPMPDGRIEPRQADVLRAVGTWVRRHHASIYGTRGGPFKPGAYGASTRRGRAIYVHVLNWPNGPLRLPAIPARIINGRVLSGGRADVRQTSGGIELSVAPGIRDPSDTVVVLKLDTDAAKLPAVDVAPGSAGT